MAGGEGKSTPVERSSSGGRQICRGHSRTSMCSTAPVHPCTMSKFERRSVAKTAPKGRGHDCRDAGGRATQEQLPRDSPSNPSPPPRKARSIPGLQVKKAALGRFFYGWGRGQEQLRRAKLERGSTNLPGPFPHIHVLHDTCASLHNERILMRLRKAQRTRRCLCTVS